MEFAKLICLVGLGEIVWTLVYKTWTLVYKTWTLVYKTAVLNSVDAGLLYGVDATVRDTEVFRSFST